MTFDSVIEATEYKLLVFANALGVLVRSASNITRTDKLLTVGTGIQSGTHDRHPHPEEQPDIRLDGHYISKAQLPSSSKLKSLLVIQLDSCRHLVLPTVSLATTTCQ